MGRPATNAVNSSEQNFYIKRDGRSFKGIAMQSKCQPCKEIQKSKAFMK
jgi:hypothetical protein